jgi:hypothetical protein
LACVEWGDEGIKIKEDESDKERRKYVKPIDCLCLSRYSMPKHWREEIQKMIEPAVKAAIATEKVGTGQVSIPK